MKHGDQFLRQYQSERRGWQQQAGQECQQQNAASDGQGFKRMFHVPLIFC